MTAKIKPWFKGKEISSQEYKWELSELSSVLSTNVTQIT